MQWSCSQFRLSQVQEPLSLSWAIPQFLSRSSIYQVWIDTCPCSAGLHTEGLSKPCPVNLVVLASRRSGLYWDHAFIAQLSHWLIILQIVINSLTCEAPVLEPRDMEIKELCLFLFSRAHCLMEETDNFRTCCTMSLDPPWLRGTTQKMCPLIRAPYQSHMAIPVIRHTN